MMQNTQDNKTLTNTGDADESLTTLTTRISKLQSQITSINLADKANILKQINEDIQDSYSKILSTTLSIDQKFSTIINSMGRGVEFSRGIKLNFTDAADEVIRLGGSQQDTLDLQSDLVSSTQKNLILTGDIGKELFAASKVSGIASKDLLNAFLDSGKAIDDIGDTMYEVVKTARDLGVSAKVVSAGVVSNLDKLNRFGFENGVEGLTRMAARAATLRISMDSVFKTAEDLMSPEKAVELSASLQRLGVASSELLDPLRLMDLAQNDVGELQNQLSGLFKQYTFFDEKTQSFQIMPGARRELKAVADELGYDIKEVNKMALAGAELDKKMSEISFGNLKIDKDTQEQIANLATLNRETGTYEIVTKSGDVQSLQDFISTFEGNEENLKSYLTEQEEGTTNEEKLVNLAEEQLSSTNKMIAILNTLKSSMGLAAAGTPLGDTILKTIKDYAFKPQELVSKIAGPQGTVGETIRGIKPEDLKEISQSLIRGDSSVIDKFGLGPEKLLEIYESLKEDVSETTKIDKQTNQSNTNVTVNVPEPPQQTPPTINFTPNIDVGGISIPNNLTTNKLTSEQIKIPETTNTVEPISAPIEMLSLNETNSNLNTLNETLMVMNDTIISEGNKTTVIQDLLIDQLPKIGTSINDFITIYSPEKTDLNSLFENISTPEQTTQTNEVKNTQEINPIENQNVVLNTALENLSTTTNEFKLGIDNIVSSQDKLSNDLPKTISEMSGNIKIETPEINFNELYTQNQRQNKTEGNNELSVNTLNFDEKLLQIQNDNSKSFENLGGTLTEYLNKQEPLNFEPIINAFGNIEYPQPNINIESPANDVVKNLNDNFTNLGENLSNNEKLISELSLAQNAEPIANNVNTNTQVPTNEIKTEDLNKTLQVLDVSPIEQSLKDFQNAINLSVNKPVSVEPPKITETKIETAINTPPTQKEKTVETTNKLDINHTITIDVKGNNMDNNILNSALNNPIFKQKLIQSTDLTKNSFVGDLVSTMNIPDANYF